MVITLPVWLFPRLRLVALLAFYLFGVPGLLFLGLDLGVFSLRLSYGQLFWSVLLVYGLVASVEILRSLAERSSAQKTT